MIDWLLILVGVILTAGTAVFVAAEFSLVALDPSAVEKRVAEGDRGAEPVHRSLKTLSTQLSGAQIGITLTTILLGYTMQGALANVFSPLLGRVAGETTAAALAVALSVIIVNAFSMLFGELIPKNWAIAEPMKVARFVAPLQMLFTRIFHPVVRALNGSANAVLRAVGIEPSEELSGARSPAELAALVRHSASEGTLDVSTATLLTRSIGIGALTAVDVMTDRGRMHSLPRTATAADVVEIARSTGHSRFPILGETADDIVGIVNLRRAIAIPWERRGDVQVTSSSLMVEAPRVPETLALAPLLIELRDQGLQMAVVVDEYGGTSGIVTLEDAVEEIVGEVADEHDVRRLSAYAAEGGAWVVPGSFRPDELAHVARLKVPDDGPYETLAGLVMAQLGRMPEVGDEVEVAGVTLHVVRIAGRRIELLRVRAVDEEDA
ncbi:Hemolysin, contains CBS domains [Ruaniaceae bacterium KH17]|nr:Hemolysin, contains CBS domains [Ruaniaceae bacterium KH17]